MNKPLNNRTMDLRVDALKDNIAATRGFCEVTWSHPQLFGKKPLNSQLTVPFSGHQHMTHTLAKNSIELPRHYYSSILSLREYLYENDYTHDHVDAIFKAIIDKAHPIHLKTNIRKVTVPDYFPSHFQESWVKESFYIPNLTDAYKYISSNIHAVIR